MSKKVILSPSILSADFSEIKQALGDIESAGCKWVHLDVMDGNFVPNITFGPKFISDIRKDSSLFFDTHLMIKNPEKYIEKFASAGSDCITVHVEACQNVSNTLELIKKTGCKSGLSICPETDIQGIEPYLDQIDLILVMTVHPGFGGQTLIEACLDKVRKLKDIRNNRKYLISVDGGINENTAFRAFDAGADIEVAGSAFFGADDKKAFAGILMSGARKN